MSKKSRDFCAEHVTHSPLYKLTLIYRISSTSSRDITEPLCHCPSWALAHTRALNSILSQVGETHRGPNATAPHNPRRKQPGACTFRDTLPLQPLMTWLLLPVMRYSPLRTRKDVGHHRESDSVDTVFRRATVVRL